MEAVKLKKLSNPGTASYDTVAAAMKDPLILAKLQFYMALARTFTPFLKKYQTDEPVLPFLQKDLTELMMKIRPGLCSIIRKVQDKSPLKYLTVRQMVCLDPSVMYRDPERCRKHMKGLVQRFLQDTQLTDTSAGDVILQHFDSFLSLESRKLWCFCKKLLILSYGQATVERGFSINKEDNIKEDTVVTRRLVCDYITQHGGVTQVPLSKALLESVARARTRYRAHLKTERKKREAKSQALKRKEAEDCLQELKVKRRRIQEVCEGLARDADRLAEEAERKAGNRMADLISRSNLLERP
ncbi:hypothetical protein HF521_014186 [Silurus meridionalis]|uniref:Uncharacterized protein n=1 Tax=Silurus meridionalis TaxID=175797 RepID=A0A8T0A8B5_SILME|nr:hypothetical protein HF521_014186 [Silurus meridionalis]